MDTIQYSSYTILFQKFWVDLRGNLAPFKPQCKKKLNKKIKDGSQNVFYILILRWDLWCNYETSFIKYETMCVLVFNMGYFILLS